jgi:TrmH family RNA methyltransferase
LIEDVLRSPIRIEALLVSHRLQQQERTRALIARVLAAGARCEIVRDELLRSLSDVETPPGIIALAGRPKWSVSDVLRWPLPLVLILEDIRDPGNMGTMLRSAEAFGATGLLILKGATDPFAPKVIRASMGSAVRMPVIGGLALADAVTLVREAGLTLVATSAHAVRSLSEENFACPLAILIGNEATGLSEAALQAAELTVRIPLVGPVQSLNAAAAATVFLYEAARQRGFPLKFTGRSPDDVPAR